jgi:RND family efflux transporter MFP subunit
MKRSKNLIAAATLMALGTAQAQTADLAPVVARAVVRTIDLPGEFQPFQSVAMHARVRGYVERVLVDRGSVVKKGDLLAELSAPEMESEIAETQSRALSLDAERVQAEAQLAAAQSSLDLLKQAAATPGAVAGGDLIQAQKQVDAAHAVVEAKRQAKAAAESLAQSQKELESYLRITAPFDGVVTERLVHPGALVGPGTDPVLLTIQEVAHLRLVVAVPEENVGGIAAGAKVDFRVPAYPDRTYSGTVARVAHALDVNTRTMPVELDVFNRDGSLAPGMYPSVKWPVRAARQSLLVPKTSVVTTTERTFVVRDRDGHAEWVDVRKGVADGDLIEVLGSLKAGDQVVRRATDEIREGDALNQIAAKKP